jgi:diketogulonate reductase-like aldo/keto reductase
LIKVDDPAKFERAVETALQLGYRHFDIAYTYQNERNLGNVLSKWISTGKIKREQLFINTKVI